MKIISVKQKTKEWLDLRRNHICASESSIILDMNPYKTKEKLFDEKIRGFEPIPNPYMIRGNELEPIALSKFEEETGLSMFPMVGKHDSLDWMLSSFDGVTICRTAICEIKCNGKKNHSLALEGKIPDFHNAQVQHQMFVAGLEFAYYFSFTGQEGVIIEVQRDQEFIEKMLEKEFEFWNCLQTLTPPKTETKKRKKNHGTTAII